MKAVHKYCPYCSQPGERYYSPETLAAILDCSIKTVRGWINDKSIGSVKVGGLRRISAGQLEAFIKDVPSFEQLAEEAMEG